MNKDKINIKCKTIKMVHRISEIYRLMYRFIHKKLLHAPVKRNFLERKTYIGNKKKLGSIVEQFIYFNPKHFLIFQLERPHMYVIWAHRYTDTATLKQNSYNTSHSQPPINYMSTVTCSCRCTSFILLTSHYTVFSAH